MMRVIHAFFMSLSMFTVIPCPYHPWDEDAKSMMTVCLPIVGCVIGFLWAALSLAARMLLPRTLAAAVMCALPLLLTGFIHLDGYMDTCDALLSWRPLEERLRILKDVHVGAFSVIALAILILFAFAGSADALEKELRLLILIPIVSRCMSAISLGMLKPLGHSEYSGMRRNNCENCIVCVMGGIAIIYGFMRFGRSGWVLPIEVLIYALSMWRAYRTLGGISGDLCGFSLSIAETGALVAMAVL